MFPNINISIMLIKIILLSKFSILLSINIRSHVKRYSLQFTSYIAGGQLSYGSRQFRVILCHWLSATLALGFGIVGPPYSLIATLGPILRSQLSWKSEKSQLARWGHKVALLLGSSTARGPRTGAKLLIMHYLATTCTILLKF